LKKTVSIFGLMLVFMSMAIALFTLVAPHFGWRVDIVLSGSMEPDLHTGAVVVTQPMSARSIAVGDIISFYAPITDKLTTHRVVAMTQGSLPSFTTKGDANEESDPESVPFSRVVGKVCLDIPYIGYLTRFIKTPLGLLSSLFVPGLFIIVQEVRNIHQVITNRNII
jgi:signal peptidase